MTWLTGWQYRKKHTINGSSAGAQTNYQVGIKVYYGNGTDGTETVNGTLFGKVYCNSHSKQDFGDIRFALESGALLDYWIQNVASGNNAVMWVEVDSIPASPSTKDIYVYYGNPGASSTSNSANTLPIGESFDPSFNKSWTVESGTWAISADGVTGNAYRQTDTNPDNGRWSRLDMTYSAPIYAEISYLAESDINWGGSMRLQYDDNNFLQVQIFPGSNLVNLYDVVNGTNYPYTYYTTVNGNTWYRLTLTLDSSGYAKVYLDGNLIIQHSVSRTNFNLFKLHDQGPVGRFDNVILRKWANPEPAHGTWGNEEQETGPGEDLTVTGNLTVEGETMLESNVFASGPVQTVGGTNSVPGLWFGSTAPVSEASWGGSLGVGLNNSYQIVLNAGNGVKTADSGVTKNTLDDGTGNMTVIGSLTLPCVSPYYTWTELEPKLWALVWDGNEWDWTADGNILSLGSSFIRFNDTSGTNRYLDIGIIRTQTAPEDCTLWVSKHLIIKKDFACGGAASVFQGALILGSDWDAHNPNAQMPQIMLAHSEGGSYPTNPNRDILQIWRNGHVGFARVQCGNIFVQMENPAIDLKNSGGQLKVTLKFDGTNGLLYTSAGDLVLAGYTNHVRPLSNNTYFLGNSTFKWKEIWAVTTHFGDAVFANGWRLTEDSDNSGVLLLRPDGSIAQRWA